MHAHVCVCAAAGHNGADYVHVLVEAVRLALSDGQRHLGDPEHVSVPVDALLDKSYGRRRAQRISMNRCACTCARVCVCVGASVYQSLSVDFR